MRDDYATQPDSPIAKQEEIRRIRTIWISVIITFLFTLISILAYATDPAAWASNILTIGITSVVAVVGISSTLLAWRRHVDLAGILLLGTILALSLSAPVVAHGQGLAIGIVIIILGPGLTIASLPEKYGIYGNILSLIVGVSIIIFDQIVPDLGFPSNPIYTYFSVVLIVVFSIVVARQFSEFTLRGKIAISFVAIMIIPLAIIGVYNNITTTRTLAQKSRERLSALAAATADIYDDFFVEQMNEILTEAKQIALVDFLLLPPESRANSAKQQNAEVTLSSFQRKDPIFIDSYAILDTTGKSIVDTSPKDLGRDESAAPYFTEVIKSGAPYTSDVVFLEEGEESIYFSAPIKDTANRIIGVLRVEYRATILQSMARTIIPDDPNTLILLVDRTTYLRVAYTGNRNELFKSYKRISDLELAAFQATGKLPHGTPDEIFVGVNERTTAGIDNIETTPFFDSYSGSLGAETINTGVNLKTHNWTAIARESYTQNLKAVEDQTRSAILISLALAGSAILLALGGAQILASPLISLAKVVEEIAAGDISARAKINTPDEIGMLATSFNRMADELNITLSSLEERVSERTADLEVAQQQSEKRANELQAISEISKIITSEQNLDTLLPLITRLVSERFGFYHTGIFLVEETRQFAVLQAANSAGGARMLARGHKLEIGYGIVGYVSKTGIHRIALDVGLDSVYFNNPDLPTTRSEMALPLKIRNRVIGALDVQSEKPNAFSENDAKNLSILADQISIALENAQLFERTQEALNEMEILYRESQRESWSNFNLEESMVGYQQTMKGGKKITEQIETDEIRQTVNRGITLLFNANEETLEPSVIVPIKLRGQVIGTLNIKAPTKDRQWTNDEINLVETISERLSIALENARLIQESQRQVIKQQTIRDMTEKISTSINLKNVLQIAVEELGRVMPGSEVVLKLTSKDDQGKQL